MSDTVFSGLPRFDADGGRAHVHPAGRWQKPLDAGAGREAPHKEIVRAEPLREDVPAAVSAPQVLDLKGLEASLAALNGQLDRIERDAQAQALHTLQSMASKLFPELSKHFLAEEIGRHLEKLVPASAAVIEIRADAELAEQLGARLEGHPGLSRRCTITPAASAGQGRVDVSWKSGGLSFDYDGLLAACLSQLNSTQSVTRE